MLFNSFKDNVIDEETGPDEYVRACVEKYGCIEGFCAIFVTENRYYCYSYSPERILVFRRSNLFNLKYTCVEKVEKIQKLTKFVRLYNIFRAFLLIYIRQFYHIFC